MSGQSKRQGINFRKLIPLLLIVAVAVTAFIAFRDQFSFDALSENRQVLIDFRSTRRALQSLLKWMSGTCYEICFLRSLSNQ